VNARRIHHRLLFSVFPLSPSFCQLVQKFATTPNDWARRFLRLRYDPAYSKPLRATLNVLSRLMRIDS